MNEDSVRVFIAMGANLGNPLQQIDVATKEIGTNNSIKLIAMSPVYESIPHGIKEQPDFTNSVLEVETTITPEALLKFLQCIETEQGRERKVRWGARTLDLDLILYSKSTINSDILSVPHPRAHEREFVVKPLYDLDNDLMIPPHGAVAELVKTLPLENLTEVRHGITYHD